jgi:hypothetical protein
MRAFVLLTSALLFSACGVEDPAVDSGVVTSSAGLFEATTEFDPSPPAVGKNRLTLRLQTRDGAAVQEAKISAEPWMPAHSHGSAVRPSVQTEGGGTFVVDDLRFTMPGTWQVRIEIDANGLRDNLVVSADVQ